MRNWAVHSTLLLLLDRLPPAKIAGSNTFFRIHTISQAGVLALLAVMAQDKQSLHEPPYAGSIMHVDE